MKCPFCKQINHEAMSRIADLEEENARLFYKAEERPVPVDVKLVSSANAYFSGRVEILEILLDEYRQKIMDMTSGCKINEASPREWELSKQVLYLKKDNDALRELAEEYRKLVGGSVN